MSDDFIKDLEHVINCHSKENGSNTPDWILAEFLNECLSAWNNAVRQRESWYGRDFSPGSIISEPENYTIIINGKEKIVNTSEVCYNDIVMLVDTDRDKSLLFTITYSKAEELKPEGILAPGEVVWVKDGTIFNAYVTDNA